jgi:peptidoglycan/xylan/chitin deacetylase (PgdA/CDA1 family)
MKVARVAVAVPTALALAPSLVSLGPVRHRLTPVLLSPRLSGIAATRRVALTFDDGPDAVSTPRFLSLLSGLGVRATFFVLGRHLAGQSGLLHEMVAAGNELGVHGWDHRPVALHSPRSLREGIRATRASLEDATGCGVRWYRPPYGLVTSTSLWAARAAGLKTVLWSAWGRDWERQATPESVRDLVQEQLRPGGTVLLHDSDRTSAPGSWRTTLAATGLLVPEWQARRFAVGPLSEHWAGVSTLRSQVPGSPRP